MALIARERLTKSFLMAQRTGTFIASNCCEHERSSGPRFGELIVEPSERAAQWERIKDVRADRRLCNVYDAPEDHWKWIDNIEFQ